MAKKNGKDSGSEGGSTIALNKRARHEYHLLDRYEAGLVLQGWELKAIRSGRLNMGESYALVKGGEIFLFGAQITPLISASSHVVADDRRTRKLLLHKHEIDKLVGKVEREGYTLIPTAMYWKKNKVKLEIALAKGKQEHDKRDVERERDWQREKQRTLRRSNRDAARIGTPANAAAMVGARFEMTVTRATPSRPQEGRARSPPGGKRGPGPDRPAPTPVAAAVAALRRRVYTVPTNPREPRMKTARAVMATIAALATSQASASFHLMQIEQAIGGVAGDVSQQAVQLRMRSDFQNQMQFSRLRVFDSSGANPVVLLDFTSPVANFALGDRVLVTSAAFAAAQGPVPDAVMTATIPPSYFAGGRLTFEGDGGDVVYSLCWGGYTGSTAGSNLNDADGVYGPCEPGSLPSSSLSALRFDGAATALGTNNATDYSLTSGPAVFTNNARASVTLGAPPAASRGGDCNDADPTIHPGVAEVAGNRRDDDCDGLADEDVANIPSLDGGDLDGDGQSIAGGDCDDQDASVLTGASEIVGDRKDNDCDRRADEDAADVASPDGFDHDMDGYGMFDRRLYSGFE